MTECRPDYSAALVEGVTAKIVFVFHDFAGPVRPHRHVAFDVPPVCGIINVRPLSEPGSTVFMTNTRRI
jgi:hypothetical protein